MAGSGQAMKDKPQRVQQTGGRGVLGFAAQLPLGVIWLTCGICSYAMLTVAARLLLHSEKAVELWHTEVPITVYDRSMFMFATAFIIDALTVCFEYKSSRLDMVLLPVFIKGVATLTNVLVRFGGATLGAAPDGSMVMVQRYICWMHTVPTILLLVKMISTNITKQQAVRAIICAEVMVVTGLIGALCSGWSAVFWGVVSHLAFLPLLPYLHQGLTEAGCVVSVNAAGHTMTLVYYVIMMMWVTFGLVWDMRMLGYIPTDVEEVIYLCCDFSAKVLFSSGLMLSNFKGMDYRRQGVMRQIQETHRQTLIQELKRAIEQKDAFMSSVSHELRTPLNGIIGISEGLLSGCCGILNESVRRQIYIMRTSGARLLALINDVMDAAALRQHRLVLKQERLDLRQVVGDVSDLTRSLVDNDVSLRNDVPEGLVVWADSGRIIQVLNNLLGNAAKFTHQGFIRVSASWHDPQHQWIAIHVTDTGIGIPKQKLASIFLPFEQVDGSISRQYGGFGLGLSITQELVKAHGGELWVKSREGKGSSFTFTLPSFTGQTKQSAQQPAAQQAGAAITAPMIRANSLAALNNTQGMGQQLENQQSTNGKEADGAGTLAAEQYESCAADEYTKELPYDAAQLSALASSKPFTAGSSASQSKAASGSGNPLTNGSELTGSSAVKRDPRPTQFARTGRHQILSVDDDHVNQTVVQSLLSSTGYEVVTLSSGRQMLEYLDDCEVLPDLILLDVMMPDMSGPEVCAELAKRPVSLPVPIIMVSAHAEEAVVVKGLDSGADDYITKPFRREEFLARIRAKLQLSANGAVDQVYDTDEGEPVVMCADDDEVNHIILEGMLQSQNFRYLKARSGAEALRMLDESASRPPHLVLLDASLPDTTGLDVLQQLRSRFSKVALPVVMLTARHNERAIVEALDSGANDYAVKPFRRSELLARIRMHLRSSQRAAAAAAEPAPGGPVAAALAQADQDLSAELRQLVPAAEHLKTVPLLVAQLSGLEQAAAGLTPEQLSALLGTISDTFDATVEKYAMLKVEATDNCLTIAAPLASSANSSARNSFQIDQRSPSATPELRSPVTSCTANAVHVAPAGRALQRLLQVAQELMAALDMSGTSQGPVAAKEQCALASGCHGGRAPSPVQLPECCREVLQLRVALHVGELHAGVVGARRPRYRLLGPALHFVKQAAAAAPGNSIVATDAAASQLLALGLKLVRLSGSFAGAGSLNCGATTAADNGGRQLWLVIPAAFGRSGGSADCRSPYAVAAPACATMPSAGTGVSQLPIQASVQQSQQQVLGSQLYKQADLTGTQHKQSQVLPGLQQQPDWTSLLLQQQQQLMALAAQLGGASGVDGATSVPGLAGLRLGIPGWLDGLAPLGQVGSPTAPMAASCTGVAPSLGSNGSSAGSSHTNNPPMRSISNVSSAYVDAQSVQQSWTGLPKGYSPTVAGVGLNGQACTAAAADFAAALGALAGWQLGSTEIQQIMMIQHELDLMQQQLAAVAGGCVACPPFDGCRGGGSCQAGTQAGVKGRQQRSSIESSLNGQPTVAVPAGDGDALSEGTVPNGVSHQSSSAGTGERSSPAGASDSVFTGAARRISSSSPVEQLLSPKSGGTGGRASFSQLFKRRSRKQRSITE